MGIDITGHRFGRLVAIKSTGRKTSSRSIIWECLCDCGKTVFAPVNNLRSGNSLSCGCLRISNLAGLRFGRLTVLNYTDERTDSRSVKWYCLCDCGNVTLVPTNSLRTGNTQSCGCLYSTHGKRYSPEYSSWRAMLNRCFNPKCDRYYDYGGRGITVCERWMAFENFYADMGDKPTPEHSIDRYPNNDGNYEKSNCRWATPLEQAQNRRPKGILLIEEPFQIGLE